jgi:hypothetical protein
LTLLLEHFGIESRTDVNYPRHAILSRGDDEIAIPIHLSAYDQALGEVFSPLTVFRVLDRYQITREEFCAAYNQFFRAA